MIDIGMDSWKRKQVHSHVYRVPGPFRNEVIESLLLYICIDLSLNLVMDDDGGDR